MSGALLFFAFLAYWVLNFIFLWYLINIKEHPFVNMTVGRLILCIVFFPITFIVAFSTIIGGIFESKHSKKIGNKVKKLWNKRLW